MDASPAAANRMAPQPNAPQNPQTAALRRVAEEFEGLVLGQMLQPIFEQLDANGLGGGGIGEETFRPLLVQQYAASMAQGGGIGLADSIVREMTRMQATSPLAPSTTQANPAEAQGGADR